MKKEDLIKLKEKLSELSLEEERLRNLYLRKISLGEVYGPMVGYASIDKPWLRCYNEEYFFKGCSKMTMYEYLLTQNKNNSNMIALNYFGNKILFKQLFKNINIAYQKYANLGIKKDDTVSICGVCTPEVVYTIYALNKLGVRINMIDPRSSSEVILEYIKMSHSNNLIIIDKLSHLVDGFDKKVKLNNIVELSVADSLPLPLRLAAGFKQKKNSGILNYKDIEIVTKYVDNVESYKDDEAVIVYTGGTTGKPKGVILTNDNFNNMSFQYGYSNFGVDKGQKFLDIITPTFAYGICNSLHLPLTLGMEVIIIPVFDPKKFGYYLNRYKPNHTLGVPKYWEDLLDDKTVSKKNLSYLYSAGCGGAPMSIDKENEIDSFLKKHGSPSKVAKGYGMTELSSAVVVCNKSANEFGSVGVPMINSMLSIVDPDTNDELGYNEIGEICLSSPTLMKEYLNNPSETDELISYGNDGIRWAHTGDLGYVDEQGNLFIKDRIKRIIFKRGIKVYPIEIENVISKHPAVKNCCVVAASDECWVEVPIAYIELREECVGDKDAIFEEIKELCTKELKAYSVPHQFIMTEIPLTKMGKNDYKKLERKI